MPFSGTGIEGLGAVSVLSAVATAWVGVGAASAFVTGLTGSAHCALMCGPLACAAVPGDPRPRVRRRARLAWHVGRFAGYATVGAALGLAGEGARRTLAVSVQPVLPWLMAAGLLATALELGKRLPALPGLRHAARKIVAAGASFSPAVRAGAMGAATALLPCGLLYGLLLAALATGSVIGGAAVMLAFALGGAPALAVAQSSLGVAAARRPRLASWLRRAVPAFAAGVLVWRALVVAPAGAAEPGAQGSVVAPRCH